jgi:hypothetical protein
MKKELFTRSSSFSVRYVMNIKVPKIEKKLAKNQRKMANNRPKKTKNQPKIGWNQSKLVPVNFCEAHVRSWVLLGLHDLTWDTATLHPRVYSKKVWVWVQVFLGAACQFIVVWAVHNDDATECWVSNLINAAIRQGAALPHQPRIMCLRCGVFFLLNFDQNWPKLTKIWPKFDRN